MIRVSLAQASPPPGSISGNALWVDALLVGGILLVIASALMLLRNRKRQAGQALSGRDHLDHLRESTRERDRQRKDLESVALSIEEMARRVGAQLDNKASRVEALLDEAERTIRRLEAAQAGATRTADQPPASVAALTTANAGTSSAAAEALAASVAKLSPLAGESAATPPSPAAEAASPVTPSPPAAAAPSSADDLSSRVRSLAASGLEAADIAAEVGEHIGKVELILALARDRD